MTSDAAKPIGGRLHGVSLSPSVRKVRAVLAIKGIEYELVPVMPGAMAPEFLLLSPLSKVPVWEEEGFSVPDSSVIAAYLERVVPTPSVLPEDPRRMARDLFWEEYADTLLFVPEVDSERLTVGALSIWAPLVNLERADLALDRERWPVFTAFVDRLSADPNLAPLIEEERSMLGGH